MAEDQRIHSTDACGDDSEAASLSYVVQFPKDWVYSNAQPQQSAAPQRRRKPCCCRCIGWFCFLLILLILLIVAAAAVLYAIFLPRIPKYSLGNISVSRFKISKDQRLSSDLVLSVQARNPNKKIGIYYDDGNRLSVLYSGKEISSGIIPAFFQAPKNTTLVQIKLTASGVPVSAALHSALNADQEKGSVPLDVEMHEPVQLNIGSLISPKVTVKLRCSLTVNQLAAKQNVRIKRQSCSVKIKL